MPEMGLPAALPAIVSGRLGPCLFNFTVNLRPGFSWRTAATSDEICAILDSLCTTLLIVFCAVVHGGGKTESEH